MKRRDRIILLGLWIILLSGCAGRYIVKSYPSDAKLYMKDIRTNEKKLIGNTPTSIQEDPKLGDVFFLVLEKDNYKPKEIMIKVNEGESLTVAARMEPLMLTDSAEGKAGEKKNEDQKPQPGSPKKDEEPKNWEQELADLKLRVALLENTASFTKDALFSPRLAGGLPSNDRDRKENVVSYVFQAQKAIMRGRYDEALAQIDKALQLDDYSINAWLLKGSINYLKKDYPGAKVAWERTLKLDPYNKTAYTYLNNVYKLMNIEPMVDNPDQLRYPSSTIEIERRNRPANRRN
jgi:tetratricopeptide (TPR) repeat protein